MVSSIGLDGQISMGNLSSDHSAPAISKLGLRSPYTAYYFATPDATERRACSECCGWQRSRGFELGALLGMNANGALLVGTAIVSIALAASATAAYLALRPYDAAWNPINAAFYEADATEPWSWRRFYAWKQSDGVLTQVELDGESNPEKMANFAGKEGVTYHWWDGVGSVKKRPSGPEKLEATQVNKLVDVLSGYGDTARSGTTSLRPDDNCMRGYTPLLAAHAV